MVGRCVTKERKPELLVKWYGGLTRTAVVQQYVEVLEPSATVIVPWPSGVSEKTQPK